jgi:hypothetical protein
MGLETQAILPGHLTAENIAGLLSKECKIKTAAIRAMHRPEYKVIEFLDSGSRVQVLNLFLQSYAASDYADVFTGDSTLVTAEFSPDSFEMLSTLAGATGGYVQRVSGEAWSQVPIRVS